MCVILLRAPRDVEMRDRMDLHILPTHELPLAMQQRAWRRRLNGLRKARKCKARAL
jgi:hypothetical protein